MCEEPALRWSVDHDHHTGLVTGVVCTPCNVSLLAASKHDVVRVKKLLQYLESPPAAQLGITVVAPRNDESNLHTMWRYKQGALA